MFSVAVFVKAPQYQLRNLEFVPPPALVPDYLSESGVILENTAVNLSPGDGEVFQVIRYSLPGQGILTWVGLYRPLWRPRYPQRGALFYGAGIWTMPHPGKGDALVQALTQLVDYIDRVIPQAPDTEWTVSALDEVVGNFYREFSPEFPAAAPKTAFAGKIGHQSIFVDLCNGSNPDAVLNDIFAGKRFKSYSRILFSKDPPVVNAARQGKLAVVAEADIRAEPPPSLKVRVTATSSNVAAPLPPGGNMNSKESAGSLEAILKELSEHRDILNKIIGTTNKNNQFYNHDNNTATHEIVLATHSEYAEKQQSRDNSPPSLPLKIRYALIFSIMTIAAYGAWHLLNTSALHFMPKALDKPAASTTLEPKPVSVKPIDPPTQPKSRQQLVSDFDKGIKGVVSRAKIVQDRMRDNPWSDNDATVATLQADIDDLKRYIAEMERSATELKALNTKPPNSDQLR
ncbi:hypothetical protein [Magnetospirillum gryphiswaldense]|uniref:Uncharacterized protein n=1 Tax=Magnetospirillum gryphiswaldense TaxID=55518 RepID=A4U1U2_9PROT|nr:hypothetical protein [Magnetospirillum gryphiswaldense]AVM76091.1 hypothetical protein MSR1_36310 [Magnetospirillum gryphiswaldense MSR-1]AVM79994.1 hypothetical protein MSR1L_36310 [Magnetospirillum gryphiswaldense]CAM76849.1 hypothetical protein MGR_1096 [Magnetospirillum gryphiswaldense MSR-1]